MAKKLPKSQEITDDLKKVALEATPEAPVSETVNDNDDLDAVLMAEIDRLLSETVATAPSFEKAKQTIEKVAKMLKKVDLQGQRECEIVLTLNIFGQVLPAQQILKAIRTQILNPVFSKNIDPENSVFARFVKYATVLFPEYQFALTTPDRVAVDGKTAVNLDDVLINQFENGKDSKVSSPLAHPEVSLAVRFYLQLVIASEILKGNTKAKFFAVGKSETYKHVSSTSQNFSKILRACVEPYDAQEYKVFFDTDQFNQPRIAYAKAGIVLGDDGSKTMLPATAYTIKEIGSLSLSNCNDMIQPNSLLSFDKIATFLDLMQFLSEKKLENAEP
jgi:hypothetical protein